MTDVIRKECFEKLGERSTVAATGMLEVDDFKSVKHEESTVLGGLSQSMHGGHEPLV